MLWRKTPRAAGLSEPHGGERGGVVHPSKALRIFISEIREVGSLEGDIVAPRVNIVDGAHFKGSVDMAKPSATAEKPYSKGESKISFGTSATEGTA